MNDIGHMYVPPYLATNILPLLRQAKTPGDPAFSMKLTSVVLTALPFLVLAVPNPPFGGSDHQHVDHANDSVPKLDGEAPGVTRFRPDDVEYHDEYESLHARALEARDDVDHCELTIIAIFPSFPYFILLTLSRPRRMQQ